MGSVLFGKTGCRKDYIRKLCRLGEKDLLGDHEFHILQCKSNMILVGVGKHGVLAHQV